MSVVVRPALPDVNVGPCVGGMFRETYLDVTVTQQKPTVVLRLQRAQNAHAKVEFKVDPCPPFNSHLPLNLHQLLGIS